MQPRPGKQWAYWACAGALDKAVIALTARIDKAVDMVVGKIVDKINWRIVVLLEGFPTPDSCRGCGVRSSSRGGRFVFWHSVHGCCALLTRLEKRQTLPRLTVADLTR